MHCVSAVVELQGGVSKYLLNISGVDDIQTLQYPADTVSVHLAELKPNTRYEALLTLVMHGGAIITSDPAYATTTDGGTLYIFNMPCIL